MSSLPPDQKCCAGFPHVNDICSPLHVQEQLPKTYAGFWKFCPSHSKFLNFIGKAVFYAGRTTDF